EETLAILDDEGLAARAAAAGERLLSGLRARLGGHRLVRDVRGRGLLVGIELGPTERGALNKLAPGLVRSVARGAFGQWASLRLLERGIIAQPASHRWDVLRLEPPLTVADAEIDTLIAGVGDVLDAYEGITPLLRDVTARLGRQAIARWRF
ncbi:MAG: aminotransferase class III-fold pyridoxal phosphate-dependent enzyme, partial [Myxococcales bacterium]|nr:aminotransferase class III-fold pyridoxal phosphate-dependent enzyme [Myxococcales bacterium]